MTKMYRCKSCGAVYSEEVAQKYLELVFQPVEVEEPRPAVVPVKAAPKSKEYSVYDKHEEEPTEDISE